MLDRLAGAVSQANRDARTSDAICDQYRLILDELGLHRRMGKIDVALAAFRRHLPASSLILAVRRVVAILDADAAPNGDADTVHLALFFVPS